MNTFFVGEKSNRSAGRQKLHQQPKSFSGEFAAHQVNAGNIRTGLVETCDNSLADEIAGHEDDWYGCCNRLCRPRGRRAASCSNDGRLQRSQFTRQFPQLIILSVGPAIFDLRGLAIDVSESSQPPQKTLEMWLGIFGRSAAEKADRRHCLLLGARYRGPRYAASDKPKKFPPPHALP